MQILSILLLTFLAGSTYAQTYVCLPRMNGSDTIYTHVLTDITWLGDGAVEDTIFNDGDRPFVIERVELDGDVNAWTLEGANVQMSALMNEPLAFAARLVTPGIPGMHTLTIRIYGHGLAFPLTRTYVVYVTLTLIGVDQPEIKPHLIVYPQPASDHVKLRLEDDANWTYELFDIQGVSCMTGSIQPDDTRIDVTRLSSGVYSLILYSPSLVRQSTIRIVR